VGTHSGHTVWSDPMEAGTEIHGTIASVDVIACIGCLKCIDACPVDVFVEWEREDGGTVVDPEKEQVCIECLVCEVVCPVDAIYIKRSSGSQDTLDSLLRRP
jgi:NAD-dependent dihydropyrimidine dehydrogenase PreA subunit